KFAERLSPGDEFETLRDFGFGNVSGVLFPSEAAGSLREPVRWTKQSANSMAIGYEVAVTPLQLALAYGAFANGGALVEPALVKEIRAPDGTVLYRHAARVVRQVVTPAVARRVMGMLDSVVEGGTAAKADLASYCLAGKTGTPRATVNGKYVPDRYNPNFVGLFPCDAPQYVIVVKLTSPHSSIYAASTAAPVTKTIIQAALAARDAALDRAELAASRQSAPAQSDAPDHPAASVSLAQGESAAGDWARLAPSAPFVVTLPARRDSSVDGPPRPVPDVRRLTLRAAVRALQTAGFRVQLLRAAVTATLPASGVIAPAGAVVKLEFDYE
ncbi:MAG TPA: penicillin-binding transpeptidase domain-containing protein, partial [Gemmatimonadaceae bacterium]|nr:penicillin-binding transpeptidase domain-containing protein [Gemmatimonadaceae bacterium]